MFVQVSLVGKNKMDYGKTFVLLAFVLLIMLQISPAHTKTLSVPESSPTIKGALIKAQPGDIVLVSCGTYFEHDIIMKPGVALWSGTLQPGCVTIDAQGKGQVFHFTDADTNTHLVGFTLRGGIAQGHRGDQGGAIHCKNSSPRISNCIMEGNTAGKGGAFFSDPTSSPVLSNCLFENNEATTRGGAVHCLGTAIFRQCAFVNNFALIGGGLHLGKGSTVELASCSLGRNSAGNTGGAIHTELAQCTITSTIISDNWGGLGGSALSSVDSHVKIQHSTLYGNSSDTDGGVLALEGIRPQLNNCIIANSKTAILRADSDVPYFQGCNLYGNSSGDWVANLRSLARKNDNISQDPQFCAPEYGNFSLKNSSACLPGNNPSGNKRIVGAFGPGCASAGNIAPQQRSNTSGFQAVQAGL